MYATRGVVHYYFCASMPHAHAHFATPKHAEVDRGLSRLPAYDVSNALLIGSAYILQSITADPKLHS